MPTARRNITEIARDFAEGTEVAVALKANVPIASTDQTRAPGVHRWLQLSEWARTRELRELEHQLAETLEQLRLSSESAQVEVSEAERLSNQSDGFLHYVIECDDPENNRGLLQHVTEAQRAWRNAAEVHRTATQKRSDYVEAQSAVAAAQLRVATALRHYAHIRRVRFRTMITTFLLTAVLFAIVTAWLHFRW